MPVSKVTPDLLNAMLIMTTEAGAAVTDIQGG
jgi:hypothetical protein